MDRNKNRDPWGPHDKMNAIFASGAYIGASKILSRHMNEKGDLLDESFYSQAVMYAALPFVMGLVAAQFRSVAKFDSPLLAYYGTGLLVTIATLVTGVNILGSVTFNTEDLVKGLCAAGGFYVGGMVSYKRGEDRW